MSAVALAKAEALAQAGLRHHRREPPNHRRRRITLLTSLCEKTRNDAYNKMVMEAMSVGANAIIGVRYDTTEVMAGVTEVLCYGTAVVIEPQ